MKNSDKTFQDLAEIRSMMERSSRFLFLSGWAGIMAGIYALSGAWITYSIFDFHPNDVNYSTTNESNLLLLAAGVLLLALFTAVILSTKKATSRGEKIWNSTTRRLLISMAIPMAIGGILILMLIAKGLVGLVAPLMLIFYGLSLISAGQFTPKEVKWMGLFQTLLGLLNIWFLDFGLLFWAIGFGIVHIVYGIYMFQKYER